MDATTEHDHRSDTTGNVQRARVYVEPWPGPEAASAAGDAAWMVKGSDIDVRKLEDTVVEVQHKMMCCEIKEIDDY